MLLPQKEWKIYQGLWKRLWFKVFFVFQELSNWSQQAQETLTISELFSFLHAWTCPVASLLVAHTNGPSQMVYASCFLFSTLFEGHRPHVRHNTGPSQQSTKCPIHVEALLSQILKKLLDWCGHWEKNTTDGVSFHSSGEGVQIYCRKPALADDRGRPLPCRHSSHWSSGKSQHYIAHN